ncbi:MAG: hypothetical protein HY924_16530 [Elusimicrobia bacterium]|nr:hypothetical protein [Elusimicrobiota bacterium]
MPTTRLRLAAPCGLPLLALGLAVQGCVSLDEVQIPSGAVRPDQRTAVIVYAAPGPWVTQEDDTKAESAAKILPGVGQFMQSVQDDSDLKTSNDLRQYYSSWPGAESFRGTLVNGMRDAGYPGTPVSWQEAGAPPHVLERFNRAENVLDWRRRYFTAGPLDLRHLRDYSQVLEFDGHLILEVNLQYGLLHNAEGNVYPSLRGVSRLYRANTMKLLWSREDSAEDKTEPKNIYEFKAAPAQLSEKLDKLALSLAGAIAAGLRSALAASSAPPPPPGQAPAAAAAPVMPVPWIPSPPPAAQESLAPAATGQAEIPLAPPATGQAETPQPAP